jgi:cellulose synthase/poly-beta-1,6-N-acetylglucosamine synthase-like glycosyltransferase
MKILANVAGILLGLLFLMASTLFFVMLFKHQTPPAAAAAGSPPDLFMRAVMPTGFMVFVKVFEFLGAILVMIPATRNFGLLALGPITLNILAFHILIAKGGEGNPMIIAIVVLELFLLWSGRKAFAGLKN